MKAQHFARNILAAAVLSALGAHAAVAADFSEGVYENHGEQDVYDNFIVKNTDGAELDNSTGVLIQKRGGNVGSLTVNKQFRVDPENRGIYTQSDSSKKSSRNIWSLAVVSVDQRY